MAKIQEEMPDLVVGVDFGMTYTGTPHSSQKSSKLNLNRGCMDEPPEPHTINGRLAWSWRLTRIQSANKIRLLAKWSRYKMGIPLR